MEKKCIYESSIRTILNNINNKYNNIWINEVPRPLYKFSQSFSYRQLARDPTLKSPLSRPYPVHSSSTLGITPIGVHLNPVTHPQSYNVKCENLPKKTIHYQTSKSKRDQEPYSQPSLLPTYPPDTRSLSSNGVALWVEILRYVRSYLSVISRKRRGR